MQKAVGYVATLVAGEVTYENGEATGARPGTTRPELMSRSGGTSLHPIAPPHPLRCNGLMDGPTFELSRDLRDARPHGVAVCVTFGARQARSNPSSRVLRFPARESRPLP